MKTLLVMRHAKSSWDDPGQRDFDRPLNKRGKKDAPRMGRALAARGLHPDLVLASPAARVKLTLEAFLPAAGIEIEPRYEESLYGASAAEMMALVRRLPAAARCALLVGHNPGLEELVGRLSGSSGVTMSTAALACLEVPGETWSGVEDGGANLAWLLRPKELA